MGWLVDRAARKEQALATFVLVHPAWLGGWCWSRVAALLRARGNEVHAPTLTGLGERAHLATPEVGLQTHITDVVNLVTFEGLTDIVLVGTSSSGTVVTGVAATVADRIGSVVYLDAFVPSEGQSTRDLLPPERQAAFDTMVATEGDGWLLPRFAPPPWPVILRELWQVVDDADAEWVLHRLRPTPYRHFTEPLAPGGDLEGVRRSFVCCSRRPFAGPTPFDSFAADAQSNPGWTYREIDAPHVAYVTHPHQVAAALVTIATPT